jgi:hypothetical protein
LQLHDHLKQRGFSLILRLKASQRFHGPITLTFSRTAWTLLTFGRTAWTLLTFSRTATFAFLGAG